MRSNLCVRRQVFPLKVFVTQWITTHSVWNISVFSAICWWVFQPFCCVGIFCNWQTTKCVQRHLATSFSNEYFYLANSLPRNQTWGDIWTCTMEENRTNATIAVIRTQDMRFVRAFKKRTVEKSQTMIVVLNGPHSHTSGRWHWRSRGRRKEGIREDLLAKGTWQSM